MKEESKKRIDVDIDSALLKKALGFDATEIVEEYALSEGGEVKLSKKKITKKSVPPDVSALKMLLERVPPLTSMTDEELEAEKQRLIGILVDSEKTKKEKSNCKKTKKA